MLTSARATLPETGETSTAALIDVVPLDIRELLLEANCLSEPKQYSEALRKYPVFCNVLQGDYVTILRLMDPAGMLHLYDFGQGVVENGIFRLSKT